MVKDLSDYEIQYIKGVGPRRAALLKRLNIRNVRDAMFYLPYRYEDRRNIKKIRDINSGFLQTVVGKVIAAEVIDLPHSRHKIFELTVSDGSGLIKGKWFNQPFMKKRFKIGQEVVLSGVVKYGYRGIGLEMDNPEYEFASDDEDALIHTARIVPVYRATENLSCRQLRNIIFNVLKTHLHEVTDPVPEDILRRNNLPGLAESIMNSHFPQADIDVDSLNNWRTDYQRRLSFDELFMLELGLAILKKGKSRQKGIEFNAKGTLVEKLLRMLPFSLTSAQKRAFNEVLKDMRSPYPMHRLIQGDVGSGKTVVALMAVLVAAECGYQSAFMAPTEILAEQHYINIHRLVEDLGLKICLLTGSVKDRPLDEIASGKIDLVVGTHALIQESVRFEKLGLIVIDEQHRFGVMQRAVLRKKALNPDVLIMTATPIPRTLAMTLYGDLDCSVIDELPPGRTPVKTMLFKQSEKKQIYEAIASEVRKGGQVYVVYPVIEGSEKVNLKSAIMGKEALEKVFPDMTVALIHGRMKPQERESVMADFKDGKIDILVSTTVIEVGVDVPNASMMLIVHAERFGLSQLHQLRGRVGRGNRQSSCLLLAYEPLGEEARRRLDVMTRTTDGFRIAEEDLDIRGPGEFLGTRQSGMPDLSIANLVRDSMMIEPARTEAFSLIEQDPELKNFPALKASLERFWHGKIEIFKTG
jgi:ATP-dependent DNA helicase RecG